MAGSSSKIEPAENRTDDRHYKVVDDGIDDLAERRPDNNTHGQIHDIATGNEGFKFVKHQMVPLLLRELKLCDCPYGFNHIDSLSHLEFVKIAFIRLLHGSLELYDQTALILNGPEFAYARFQGLLHGRMRASRVDHIRFGLRLCPAAVCGCKLWGQEQPEKRSQKGRPFVYALSTAIYCTSRTYFGGVGLAADKGLEFLGIYTGPILAFTIGMPIIRRIVELAKTEKLTSVADFIAARYGKNSTVAMIVAIIALVGAIPYIALQLKAVSSSVATMVDPGDYGIGSGNLYFLDLPLLVTIVMAGFAVMFGTRHTDATEHQDGLILAISMESLVKLVAMCTVGFTFCSSSSTAPRICGNLRRAMNGLCGPYPITRPSAAGS